MGKHDPYFVEAKLIDGGVAVLVDDDGEVFYVQMCKGEAWPEVSRRLRRFDRLEQTARDNEAIEHGRVPPPSPLRLVK
jgi:hypothetical protein